MTDRLAPAEADRLRRAERRWLEQARERLQRSGPPADGDAVIHESLPHHAEETDR